MARAAINREVCRWARGGVNRVRMAVEVTPYRNILKKSSFRTNTFQDDGSTNLFPPYLVARYPPGIWVMM
jgi:hypothetical protein